MHESGFQENKVKRWYWTILSEKLLFIVGAPLLAVLLTAFVFHFYKVDGVSMEKTLANNDQIVIEKFGKTYASVRGKAHIPKRYEVIVINLSESGIEQEIIKRVVALPGERVVIKEGKVTVFNADAPQGFAVDDAMPAEAEVSEKTEGTFDIVVPEGAVYALGDNRAQSVDSRYFGPINSDEIIGKMVLRLFPVDRLTVF